MPVCCELLFFLHPRHSCGLMSLSKSDICNSGTGLQLSGITNFNPDMVINQGIAGAHRKDLHVGDIVIGEKCCNINS